MKPAPNFDGHANCFIESGGGKGMLLDFNYETQPYTGEFPLPGIGPMSLLKETRANHWAKVAFRWVYWNLITGKPLPFTADMYPMGKKINVRHLHPGPPEGSGGPPSFGRRRACSPLKAKPAPGRPTVARPTSVAAPKASGPKVNPKAAAAFEALPEYVAQQGIDSTADPATAGEFDPIVPKF